MATTVRNNLDGTYSVFLSGAEYVYDDKTHELLDLKDLEPVATEKPVQKD